MMLMSLPIVLACVGLQPCPAAATVPGTHSPRTSSAAAIVSHAPWRGERLRDASSSLRLAVERVPLPSPTQMSSASTQPPLKVDRSYSTSKAAYICALTTLGAVAGVYAGAALEGDSGGDSPGMVGAMIGLPIGAVVGGLLGWRFVP